MCTRKRGADSDMDVIQPKGEGSTQMPFWVSTTFCWASTSSGPSLRDATFSIVGKPILPPMIPALHDPSDFEAFSRPLLSPRETKSSIYLSIKNLGQRSKMYE